MMKESRMVCGWFVRGGNAAAGCSSMGTDAMDGESRCGNLLWQSCRAVLSSGAAEI